jgi:putative membrane protein
MKKSKCILQCACTLVFLFAASCNNANNTSQNAVDSTKSSDSSTSLREATNKATTSMAEKMEKNPDSNFVVDVVMANGEEIKVLQAGEDMGGKSVKEHARMMLADHKKLAKEMDDYAAKHNYTVAPADRDKQVSEVDDIKKKTGKDRDKEWVDFLVGAHEKTIGKFEGAQNNVKDADLKTMIGNTLPTLHKHLDMLNKMKDEMK